VIIGPVPNEDKAKVEAVEKPIADVEPSRESRLENLKENTQERNECQECKMNPLRLVFSVLL